MLRLIEPNFSAARQHDRCLQSPRRFIHICAYHILGGEPRNLRLQVVAHQVQHRSHQRMPRVNLFCAFVHWMECGFGGRHCENKPAVANVNCAEAKNVAEECAVGCGILAVQQNMSAHDHRDILATLEALANSAQLVTVQTMYANIRAGVDVVGVGVNAADTLIQLPHFPVSDSKVEFSESAVMLGGQVASAMVACAKWGLRTRYAGKIGDDEYGELHRKEFADAGVDAKLICASGCASQSSFILVDQSTGERTVLWKRDSRVALQSEDLNREWIIYARALLVDGHDTAAAALASRWARESGIPVTADLDNLYPGVEVLLEYVDFVVTSKEFPARLTGEKDLLKSLPIIQRRFKNRLVAATLGPDGVLAWDGSEFHYCPAFRVNAVDTTGAGDIFHAAFVYAQLAEMKLEEILSFSCAAAALNCTAPGARGNVASLDEIRKLMLEGSSYADAFRSRKFQR